MDESELLSFIMWSAITGIIMLVTGLSYKAYLGRNDNEISSS
ncbi:MAG: hypothetical protein OEY17_06175 [Nitrosopumilus sp.]|nr:hypothetical protein [Nitrosopumilus sp.]MDH5658911.1 hypothetical protein [Nitrosopumilus sp.]